MTAISTRNIKMVSNNTILRKMNMQAQKMIQRIKPTNLFKLYGKIPTKSAGPKIRMNK